MTISICKIVTRPHSNIGFANADRVQKFYLRRPTFPKIIRYCMKNVKNNFAIYSPGIGTQGGKAKQILGAGSDYLIVGRTILNSSDKVTVAKNLQLQSFK